jgi:murein DD-endopeptidase MepM/ murein hydrolase activator NlpD
MRSVAEPVRSLSWSRLALTAATAVSLVSCSSDSSRFANDKLFSSRSSAPQHEVTGSVARKPSTAVQSSPLPPPTASAPQTRASASQVGVSGGSPGMATYAPPPSREVTGSVPQPQRVASQPAAQPKWSWEGGTAVTAVAGDNAYTFANRYNVPADVIVQANNLSGPLAIKPGQRLVIPRYQDNGPAVTGSVAPRAAAVPAAPVAAAPTGAGHVHTVAPGETLSKISRTYKVSLPAIAKANNIAPHTQVKIGDQLTIPGVRATQAAVKQQQQTWAAPAAQQQPMISPPQQKIAATPPAVATPTARSITPAADNPVPETKPVTTAATHPTFRWPVRGRVISGFGPKTTGTQNDGINVAVPEGTPIKAAEDGVVAYAGSELKSYGNLVLIRHANGYVTAYAHASEILVKRDEPIKRGQVIGKAGQTGNVTAPQLHFEVRKGSSPVDPMPYLDRGGNT